VADPHDPGWMGRVPAPLLVIGAAVSTQLATVFAVHAFSRASPVGIGWARVAFAALILLALRRRVPRGDARAWRWAALFGTLLAAMNLTFYAAVDRLPLAVAVTVEFWGPIAVAVVGSRRRADLGFAGLAAAGVLLLGSRPHGDAAGIALALFAGLLWAGYILAGKRVSGLWHGTGGLCAGMLVGSVALAPVGIGVAGSTLFDPVTLAICAVVGLLASTIPYTLDQHALRRLPPRTFGVLLALHPVVAVAAGALLLGQRLTPREGLAVVLVVVAGIGSLRAAAAAAPEGALGASAEAREDRA
jgi:inner membrane transporter RhtA